MRTDELIQVLAKDLQPVQPLRKPWLRASIWAVCSLAYAVALLLAISPAPALADIQHLTSLSQLAAFFTFMVAAFGAFASTVPGNGSNLLRWSVVGSLSWLVLLATHQDPGIPYQMPSSEWECVIKIIGGGIPLFVLFIVMARRAAPVNGPLTMALAALAIGALMNVMGCYSSPHTDSMATLLWHGSSIVALVFLGLLVGRTALRWLPSR
ncbi:MAG TPA: NrsF family protein [Hyphomicrobiales bacterium]|nr:NrsF family protein [Hyphomicrobiales bacterium]